VSQDQEAASLRSASSSKIGSHIPDRWLYWLAKVEDDPAWKRVTIGGLVKLAKEVDGDLSAVSMAFGWAIEDRDKIDNPMGWIRTTARAIHGAPE